MPTTIEIPLEEVKKKLAKCKEVSFEEELKTKYQLLYSTDADHD